MNKNCDNKFTYNPTTDKNLKEAMILAKQKVMEYNRVEPSDYKKRDEILRSFLGKVGDNLYIEQPFNCDYGYNISLGNNFYSNINLVILDCSKVTIGDDVLIGPNTGLYGASHPISPKERKTGIESSYPINIGNNVWIGGHVCILSGVTIGDNTIIGAGSVVTKDIPSNVIAFGNPCKVIRHIEE